MNSNLKLVLGLVAFIGIAAIVLIALTILIPDPTPRASRNGSGMNATARAVNAGGFEEKINDCGVCGTKSPIGGWETEDGRALILAENGNYSAVFADGGTASGTWALNGSQLCLDPGIGDPICYRYEQKIDAMRLDGVAVYERR